MDASLNSRLDDQCTQMKTLKGEVNVADLERVYNTSTMNEVFEIKDEVIPNLKTELKKK